MLTRLTLAAAALFVPLCCAWADVRVIPGPTPIRDGNARAAGDLTVVNERLAFALAIETAPPYGVPRGALIDIAPVSEGSIGRDRVVFADFIPNNWSAWPNTYQHVEVLDRGPEVVRVRARRDFGHVRIETLYTLRANSDSIEISATMTNEGDAPVENLLSGLTLWPSSGYLFAVPGLAGVTEGSAAAALARRTTAYDADWTVTLHAPYLDHVGSGSRDLFQLHSLAPRESRTFSGRLQVGARGNLAPVIESQIGAEHLQSGTLRGEVTASGGERLEDPVVVIEKDGKPWGWILGHAGTYQARLPQGEYRLYAAGRNYAPSAPVVVNIGTDTQQVQDFSGLEPPGRIDLKVEDARSHAPRDARIVIESGTQPVVEFLGRRTFFTDLKDRGRARLPIAPGPYTFNVIAGGKVLAPAAPVALRVPAGRAVERTVEIHTAFDPPAHGWYAADLHHHADQAEAVTPPEDLARSQLAAGLDVLFVSDHDSTANHEILRRIAAGRGVPFIAGIELSPSWGHFNAYPLNPGAQLAIDTGTATAPQVLAEARRLGATTVQVNHPFIPFGYFTSVANGVAPGGFDGSFDLVEINSSAAADDEKVLAWLWDAWNHRRPYYLTAGSDTHDVWNELSGRVRVFAHPEGALSAGSFTAALRAGHAYVTYGPVIYPDTVFGETQHLRQGVPARAGFQLGSVEGLKEARLIVDGNVFETRSFAGTPQRARADFMLPSPAPTWYALVVEDAAGRRAYSDPVWVEGPHTKP
ncbi:MAG: CehA/McbA family metallohydrolase [Proteobacteria bacterium]|nr:CehA/McbA family metallohydrolase [Pseudomonadota bacterium]